jgi:hypothetical protein
MVYNAEVMRLFGSQRFAYCALLVAATLLLCLGPFLFWTATGDFGPGTLEKADWSQMGQGANGDQHPLSGSYLVMPMEETVDSNKGPINADLLTALLLAFSFGVTVGWLLANGWGQEVFRSSSITRRPSFMTACKDTPFLGVFRL